MRAERKLDVMLSRLTDYLCCRFGCSSVTFDPASLCPWTQRLHTSYVDQQLRQVLEELGVLNWWHPHGQLLLPLKDGDVTCHSTKSRALDEMVSSVINVDQLNETISYLQRIVKVVFEDRHSIQLTTHNALSGGTRNRLGRHCGHHHGHVSSQELVIFLLSNVLQQPIVVLSSGKLKRSTGGIYLPLLTPQDECSKAPLVIGHHLGHFSPLVTMASDSRPTSNRDLLPLVNSDWEPLVIKCKFHDHGGESCAKVHLQYLDNTFMSIERNGTFHKVLALRLRSSVQRTCWTEESEEGAFQVQNKQHDANTNNLEVARSSTGSRRNLCLATNCLNMPALDGTSPFCETCKMLMKTKGCIRIGHVDLLASNGKFLAQLNLDSLTGQSS